MTFFGLSAPKTRMNTLSVPQLVFCLSVKPSKLGSTILTSHYITIQFNSSDL